MKKALLLSLLALGMVGSVSARYEMPDDYDNYDNDDEIIVEEQDELYPEEGPVSRATRATERVAETTVEAAGDVTRSVLRPLGL